MYGFLDFMKLICLIGLAILGIWLLWNFGVHQHNSDGFQDSVKVCETHCSNAGGVAIYSYGMYSLIQQDGGIGDFNPCGCKLTDSDYQRRIVNE